MFCIDDMKSCIQEWFGEALTPVEVAETYHIVAGEAEKQLVYVMEQVTKNDENGASDVRKREDIEDPTWGCSGI